MKSDAWRLLIHLVPGGFTAWLITQNPVAGVLFFLGFMIYQLDECLHLKDQAWKDIKGYLWGFALAAYVLAFF
jgi:hypothetical protein